METVSSTQKNLATCFNKCASVDQAIDPAATDPVPVMAKGVMVLEADEVEQAVVTKGGQVVEPELGAEKVDPVSGAVLEKAVAEKVAQVADNVAAGANVEKEEIETDPFSKSDSQSKDRWQNVLGLFFCDFPIGGEAQ